jgi:HlyD family secretion protein
VEVGTGNMEQIMEKKETGNDMNQKLELENGKNTGSLFKKIAIIILIIIAGFTIFSLLKGNGEESNTSFATHEIKRGNLTITVSATGSLEPRNQVDVGSELSGIVKTVEVDFNDQVSKGQTLATLDTSKLQAQVKQSKASLESANAKVLDARATLKERQNELSRLKKVWEDSGHKVPSKNDMDAAQAAFQRAIASEASALAQVSQAKATLEANETDLAKMVIQSPVNGIVLNRNVEPGQTVAASFQAPVLFTLAEDLTKMELSVDVDEADVGMVKNDQDATFAVDAYPAQTFKAKILKVKYGSDTSEGVVTYETLLLVENKDLLLRPGMTATAEIIVKNIKNSILVPNIAFRFEPPLMENSQDLPEDERGLLSKLMPSPPGRGGNDNRKIVEKENGNKKVWILRDDQPVPISVTVGLTDGNMSQIEEGILKTGMLVITGMAG